MVSPVIRSCLPLALTVVCVLMSGCHKQLSEHEKAALIANVETRIRLPEGAVALSCYRRRYLIEEAKIGPHQGKLVLIGHLGRSANPGAVMVQSRAEMAHMVDQGCQTMEIQVPLDEKTGPIVAECFPEFDGSPPVGARKIERLKAINKEAGECSAPNRSAH